MSYGLCTRNFQDINMVLITRDAHVSISPLDHKTNESFTSRQLLPRYLEFENNISSLFNYYTTTITRD